MPQILHPKWPALGQAIGAMGISQPNYAQQQQAYTPAQAAAAQQQAAVNQFNQYMQQRQEQRRWMIDGEPMTFKEFADRLFPEDTPERTMFFLKYSK